MKPLHDRSPQDTTKLDSEPMAYFETLWRELDELHEREADLESGYRKVRLDCNAELVAIGSVALVGLRESPQGTELIEFICPQCYQPHESPRFR